MEKINNDIVHVAHQWHSRADGSETSHTIVRRSVGLWGNENKSIDSFSRVEERGYCITLSAPSWSSTRRREYVSIISQCTFSMLIDDSINTNK